MRGDPALIGRVAAITGGTRGIGRAIAEAFLAEGAAVVVNGRSPEKGARCLAELDAGARALFYAGDVTDRGAVEGLVDYSVDKLGAIDVLVLNAGGSENPAPIVSLTDQEWQLALTWNLTHAFWGMRRAFRYMIPRRSGRVVCISSKQGKVGRPGMGAYVASKHGMLGLVKSAALEVGKVGITVNAICPGSVVTDIVRERGAVFAAQMGVEGGLEGLIAMHSREAAIDRPVRAEEVAGLAVYLASDLGAGVTGAALSVDGGVAPY